MNSDSKYGQVFRIAKVNIVVLIVLHFAQNHKNNKELFS